MRIIGYYVNGKNYGCTKTAKEKAARAAAEQGRPVELRPYKI